MDETNTGSDSQRVPQPLVRTNWLYLMTLPLLLIILLPYLLSPYVFIVHNPVDGALVAFLGVERVKPVLYLCITAGGMVGLLLYVPVHRLYTDALHHHVVQLGALRVFLILSGPLLGIAWSIIVQALWNAVCPSPNTGNLLAMFIGLPGASFASVVALVNLIEYHRASRVAHRQGFRLQFSMIRRQRNSYRLELVPVNGTPRPVSANWSA